MTPTVLLIISRTFLNGLPSEMAMATRATRTECALREARMSSADSFLRRAGSDSDTWMKDAAPWTKPVAPVDVESTFPKLAKAASLLRIEMASAMAASSPARSMLRFSNSFALAEQRSVSVARNSWSAASSASMVSTSDEMVEISAALSPISFFFASKSSSISSYSFVFNSMNSSYSFWAFSSAVIADSKFDLKVSCMFLMTPTISPDCAL